MSLLKNKTILSTFIFTTVGLAQMAWADETYPKVVQQFIERGVKIVSTYEAPGGLTGYVAEAENQPLSFYLTSDKKHLVFGEMVDEAGNNLTEAKVREHLLGPANQAAWAKLEKADWLLDGDANAPTVVYTFTDPNCPYCHRLRQQAQPWIEAGKVQLRHIMVGILRPDSLPKAAVIVASDDPAAALKHNQENHRQGGIKIDNKLVKKGQAQIQANNDLMESLGLFATPSTYYKDKNGVAQSVQGMPQGDAAIVEVMGSAKP